MIKLVLKRFNFFILALCLVFFAGAVYQLRTSPFPTYVHLVSSPTGTVLSHSSSLYPNPALTPGSVFPAVTVDQVCTSGYTASVRNVSVEEKRRVHAEYGLAYPQAPGTYEVDHFIPLELGGNNDLSNLWPEPADPAPGFHQKDQVENFLHDQVCRRQLSLSAAQTQIRTDWFAIFQSLPAR